MHNLLDWVTHLNWVDFTFLVVVIYSTLTGAWLGFLAECLSLAGVAAGTVVAGLAYPTVGSFLHHLGVPQNAQDWVAFVALFVLVSAVFRSLAVVARKVSRTMIRGWTNMLAGGLLGLIVGAIICLFALVTVAEFQVGNLYDPLLQSKIAAASTTWLQEYVGLLPQTMHTVPGFLP